MYQCIRFGRGSGLGAGSLLRPATSAPAHRSSTSTQLQGFTLALSIGECEISDPILAHTRTQDWVAAMRRHARKVDR